MKKIGKQEIEYIAVGAAVLGTGGGGNPSIGKLMAKRAIEENNEVDLISIDEIDDEDYYVSIAGMGAPTVSVERLSNLDEYVKVLDEMEKLYNKKAAGVYPIEAGGQNSIIPFICAAMKGIPVVDCDTMGRAFPKLSMVTFSVLDVKASPIVIGNSKNETSVLDAENLVELEIIARDKTMQMGARSNIGVGFVKGSDLKKVGIRDIVELSYNIGKIIKNEQDPYQKLIEECDATILFNAKITNITRKVEGGFNKGFVKLEGINEDKGNDYLVEIQNENIVAYKNDKLIAMVPDLFTLLDEHNAMPITTDALKYGQRVKAVAFKADEKWRSENGIKVAGPREFGYDFDYVKLEDLVKENNV